MQQGPPNLPPEVAQRLQQLQQLQQQLQSARGAHPGYPAFSSPTSTTPARLGATPYPNLPPNVTEMMKQYNMGHLPPQVSQHPPVGRGTPSRSPVSMPTRPADPRLLNPPCLPMY
jgi:hypothetical protein